MSVKEKTLSIVTLDELEASVGDCERRALEQHRDSTRLALLQNWLSFEPGQMYPFQHNIPIPETYDERLRYFKLQGVKSALLGFWLHESEFKDAKSFRDDTLLPMIDRRVSPDWSVKQRFDHTNGSDMRFYIAKSKIGTFAAGSLAVPDQLEQSDSDSIVVERRTFAAYGLDGAQPRPIDMTHALGISQRHPLDERTIVIAPTSTSFYSFKTTREQ